VTMLTEIKCGRTHFQLFNGTECVCTVRAEYKDAVKAAIEQQMASVANRDQSTEEKTK